MPVDAVRDAAIDVILRTERGVHLEDALDKTLRRRKMSDRGRRFLTQLAYGTVRHRLLCEQALRPVCHQAPEEFPAAIQAILSMAVFQSLFCDQVTRPAMVHTSVDLAKKRGHAGLGRLVNAVLRRVPATVDEVALPSRDEDFAGWLSMRYSMPPWLVALWLEEHGGETAERICAALNEPAPNTIRVNTLVNSADELLAQLQKQGLTAEKATQIPEEFTVSGGPPPVRSKLFQRGAFMLQDPSSMLAAHLLEPKPGERVLDMCAAPGGKATHLAQLAGGKALVVAADISPRRLGAVAENIARLHAPGVFPVCASGGAPFCAGFDAVLVDAPCSGLGTLRRHPDLKWRMDAEAVARLAETQHSLLRSAVGLCQNGGRIVYSVCTFSRQETLDIVGRIVHEEAVELEDGPQWLDTWKTSTGQYRNLPLSAAQDGYFLTRFRKVSWAPSFSGCGSSPGQSSGLSHWWSFWPSWALPAIS